MKATFGFVICVSFLVSGLAIGGREAAGTTAGANARLAIRYADVQRVLDGKCTSCHTGANAAQGLRLDSWQALIAGSDHGEAVIPFDAARSLLVELTTKLVGGPHPAEVGRETLNDAEVALLSEWIDEGAPSEAGEIPFAEAQHLLYAANQSVAVVSVIDMETNQVIRTVDLQKYGFQENASPHHVAVEPDGSHWYVSLIAANHILKFDRTNNLVGRIDFVRPGLLALDSDGDNLYAGRSMAAVRPPQAIGVIRRSDMTFEEVGIFLPRPHALAVRPGEGTVYTASLAVKPDCVLQSRGRGCRALRAGGRPPPHPRRVRGVAGRTMDGRNDRTYGHCVRVRSRSGAHPDPGGYSRGKRRPVASGFYTGRTLGLRGQQRRQYGQRDRHGDENAG